MTAALKMMTADEFLLWRLDREGTWELVDGVPVQKFDNGPNMMAGGSRNHARVASNLILALGSRLRGGPCYPLGSDLAVRTRQTGVRQPDVTVECGQGHGDDLEATEPRVIFEVLSPSTRRNDLVRKADEYRNLTLVQHLVLIEADFAKGWLWSRNGDAWTSEELIRPDGMIRLPSIGIELPLSEAYEGITLSD